MPKLYIRDGIYYADCTYFVGTERKRAQRTTGIKADGTAASRKTAERTAREIEGALVAGKKRRARGQTLGSAFEKRIAERTLAGASEASLSIIGEKSKHTLKHFGSHCDVSTITAEHLFAYAIEARRERAIETVKREITELRCAIRAAGHEPPEAPELGNGTPNEIWFNSEDSGKLLRHLPYKKREHAVVYRLAGLRQSELYRLEARDLLTGPNGPLLRVRGTKTETTESGGADRTFSMHEQVEAVLRRRAASYPRGPLFPDRWFSGSCNRDLTAAARKAALEFNGRRFGGNAQNPAEGLRVGLNVLRASFCTELVLAGVPLKKIAYIMGHKNTKMVERVYTRFFGAEVGLDLGQHLSGLDVRPSELTEKQPRS